MFPIPLGVWLQVEREVLAAEVTAARQECERLRAAVQEGEQRVRGLQEQLQASREDVRAAEERQVQP